MLLLDRLLSVEESPPPVADVGGTDAIGPDGVGCLDVLDDVVPDMEVVAAVANDAAVASEEALDVTLAEEPEEDEAE